MPEDPRALTELVVVCGHATFIGSRTDIMSEDQWILQPFQRSDPSTGKRGEHETFIAHILAANFAVALRPEAFLIFSGGRTTSSERSEAQGYEQVHLGLDDPFNIGDRYAREDFATDSFQNLFFSVLRFRQIVGHYPTDITVITHAFKRDRFLGVHASALAWPYAHIRVQGIDPPFAVREATDTVSSERRAEDEFTRDMYGTSPPLSDKRRARNFNPKAVEDFFEDLEPAALELLRYANRGGQGRKLPERFPWKTRRREQG